MSTYPQNNTFRGLNQYFMNITKTIYIADDDEDDRMLLREAIHSVIEDVVIKEVSHGEELIDQLKLESLPGEIIILLDMNMPKMNGLEALEVLKSTPDFLHIPVIMISTSSNPELITKAYLKGINAYIAKPFLINEYVELAQAVNICFLHNYPSFDQPATIKNIKAKSILVIEDNADQSKLINIALRHSIPNVDIININDQATSIDFISSKWDKCITTPQLILLDLYLPDRENGLGLLEMLKQFLVFRNLSSIPVIVISHSDNPLDIQDCYRLQANAYMTKSSDLTVWFSFFSYICHFWMDTIITQNND